MIYFVLYIVSSYILGWCLIKAILIIDQKKGFPKEDPKDLGLAYILCPIFNPILVIMLIAETPFKALWDKFLTFLGELF